MTRKLSRRDLMFGASSAVAAAALSTLPDRHSLAAAGGGVAHNDTFAPVDASLRRAVEKGTVAGVTAMAATQNGIVYESAFGGANLRAGSQMSTDTVFWLLSMTKPIAAAACSLSSRTGCN